MGRKWTRDEKKLLFSDLTNEEIAERTGRTVNTIRGIRYHYTGHHVEKAKHRPKRGEIHDNEARLIALAKKIGAKIEGVR